MSRMISFILADASCEARKEGENYKMKKVLPKVGLAPTASPLLDWHSYQLCHGTVLNVDMYM